MPIVSYRNSRWVVRENPHVLAIAHRAAQDVYDGRHDFPIERGIILLSDQGSSMHDEYLLFRIAPVELPFASNHSVAGSW